MRKGRPTGPCRPCLHDRAAALPGLFGLWLVSAASFPAPAFPIRIDGADTDWRQVHTIWEASLGKAVAEKGPLTVFKLASDSARLFLYAELDSGEAWSRPLEVHLDTGGKIQDMSPIILKLAGGGKGMAEAVLRTPGKGGRPEKITGDWSRRLIVPERPWGEFAFSLHGLGLRPGQDVRFRLRYGDGKPHLPGDTRIGLAYRLGDAMVLDGLDDDWKDVSARWVDPEGDALRSGDIRAFKLASDSVNLYAYCRWAGPAGKQGGGSLELILDTALGFPAETPGTRLELTLPTKSGGSLGTRDRPANSQDTRAGQALAYRPIGGRIRMSQRGDWMEAALPWRELGLRPGRKFRFTLRSLPAGDDLQGFGEVRQSRMYFPSRTVHLGAVVFNLGSENRDSLLEEYKRILMDGRTFAEGAYFNVQLAIHSDDGAFMSDETFPDLGRYEFSRLRENLSALRRHEISFFPLIPYHYLPAWLEKKHDSLYGVTRMLSRRGRMVGGNAFMPMIPDAVANRKWTVDFTRAVLEVMKPHLGQTVKMVFTGNEPMYPGDQNDFYPYDTVITRREWRRFMGKPGLPLPDSSTLEFCLFRSSRLMDLVRLWTGTALDATEDMVPVSAKLVPYAFLSGELRQAGYLPYVYDYLNWDRLQAVGSDNYPPVAEDLQKIYRMGKPMYIAEYNLAAPERTGISEKKPTRKDVSDWLVDAARDYGLEGAFFFSWNAAAPEERIHPEQVEGIRNAIGRLLKSPSPARREILVKALLPMDQSVFSGNMGMTHPDITDHFRGWARIATALQASRANLAVEMDYRIGACAPDLVMQVVGDSLVLPLAEEERGPAIYFIREPGAYVRLGKSVLRAAGPLGNAGNSDCLLADPGFSLPKGSRLMSWTPAWHAGSKYLEVENPGEESGGVDHRVLATADGKPMMVQIGRHTIISTGDPLWWMGQGTGDANLARFMAECANRLLDP